MIKNLKVYYFFIALPFALLLLGSALFFDSIKLTITRNPHPQINYTIFVIILAGGTLILLNARRLLSEAKTIIEFSQAVHAKKDLPSLRDLAARYTGETSCLLQMVAASGGRSISHQEQVAIENELSNTRAGLLRRNALPQYLTGLLVGMGLLGTFIGLLATLNDISVLINSFADLDMKSASPLLVFRTMIERMKAPMQSMGIAFSASMFGLLGSIILGLMMVGVRRLQGDMFSLLSSEVARHIELALSHESASLSEFDIDAGDVSKALIRIESRYAETARSQQRALNVLIDDIQGQRSELVRALAAQTEASNGVRSELQEFGRQLGSFSGLTAKGLDGLSAQVADLSIHVSSNGKETNKLLVAQLEEQKALRATLDSYKIEERFAETVRHQHQTLSSLIDDMEKQRVEIVRALAEQTESNNKSHGGLQQLAGQLETICSAIGKGNEAVTAQVSELTVQMTSEAKISHKLLEDAEQCVRDEMQQLASAINHGNDHVCNRISEMMQQAAASAKDSRELVSGTGQNISKELQSVGRQLSAVVESGNGKVCARVSDLVQQVAASASESNGVLGEVSQLLRGELQQLGATMERGDVQVDSRIAEISSQLTAAAKEGRDLLGSASQQLGCDLRQLAGAVEKGDDQVASRISEMMEHMLAAAKGSHEVFGSVGNSFCSELQQLGSVVERGNDEVCTRISEMMVHMAAVAREGDGVPVEQLDGISRQVEKATKQVG